MKILRNPEHGESIDCIRTMYPSTIRAVREEYEEKFGYESRTVYCYVVSGDVMGRIDGVGFRLGAGGFFSGPGDLELSIVKNALVVIVSRLGFRGMVSIGKIEEKGRLSYIDGCSDTLLVCPPRLGDPCFNHLHFPPTIVQTQHTHPSIRLGIVARGRGLAFGPGWEIPLEPGCVFLLEEGELHSFRTDVTREIDAEGKLGERVELAGGEGMDVIAYHPDSDWGPTDAAHPMRNRTYIGNATGAAGV